MIVLDGVVSVVAMDGPGGGGGGGGGQPRTVVNYMYGSLTNYCLNMVVR